MYARDIWCNTPIEMVFPLLQTVLNLSILMPFSASASCLFVCLFVSPYPLRQHISLWVLFLSRETKEVTWGKIGWIRRVGHGGNVVFGQKLLNTQHGMGSCTFKSPIMKWANALKESSKIIHWGQPNPASHNNANGNTNTDGFLEHSPSGGSLYYRGPALQKIFPVFCIPLVKILFCT